MIILTLRTDKPVSEIGLYDDSVQLGYISWEAHRQLAETLHLKITELVESKNISANQIDAIVCYKGPGSFTGLRIGISVANALAYSLQIPIVGIEGEDKWLEKGIDLLANSGNDKTVIPFYGAPVHITQPKK